VAAAAARAAAVIAAFERWLALRFKLGDTLEHGGGGGGRGGGTKLGCGRFSSSFLINFHFKINKIRTLY